MNTVLLAAACTNTGQLCLNTLPQPTRGADGQINTISLVISIVIGVTAALSILFIAIGGARYIFSQGDPGAVSKAKSTIMFALIGLVIAVFAQILVAFVINKVFS